MFQGIKSTPVIEMTPSMDYNNQTYTNQGKKDEPCDIASFEVPRSSEKEIISVLEEEI